MGAIEKPDRRGRRPAKKKPAARDTSKAGSAAPAKNQARKGESRGRILMDPALVRPVFPERGARWKDAAPGAQVTFPEWAPAAAVKVYERVTKREGAESEVALFLRRLLTDADMARAWRRLLAAGIDPEFFILGACIAFSGPWWKEEEMSQRERAKWAGNVRAAALQLAELLEGSALDHFLWLEANRAEQELFGFGLDIDAGEAFARVGLEWIGADSFSRTLRRFAESAAGGGPELAMKRPKGPEAGRAYFVRLLTRDLLKKTGKPMREVVCACARAAFPGWDVDTRQVRRLAPAPGHKTR